MWFGGNTNHDTEIKKNREIDAARIVLKVSLKLGKVTYACKAVEKLGRSIEKDEQILLIYAIDRRCDKGVAEDLYDALWQLELDEKVADRFTMRLLRLAPDMLDQTKWNKISFKLWSKLIEKVFDKLGPHNTWLALKDRSGVPSLVWRAYGRRLMEKAIDWGSAEHLQKGAHMAQKKITLAQKEQLLANLMFRKPDNIGSWEKLIRSTFEEAETVVL